jgi:hypothetical protein
LHTAPGSAFAVTHSFLAKFTASAQTGATMRQSGFIPPEGKGTVLKQSQMPENRLLFDVHIDFFRKREQLWAT